MDLDLQTLQFLTEPTKLNKLTNKQKSKANKELGFYKKRVYSTTRKILLKEKINLPSDVIIAFNNYTKLLIQHFKVVDTTDILQEEFKTMNIKSENELKDIVEINENITKDANNIIMNEKKESKEPSLNNFVKTIKCESKDEVILPLKKEINIKHQQFRNKK